VRARAHVRVRAVACGLRPVARRCGVQCPRLRHLPASPGPHPAAPCHNLLNTPLPPPPHTPWNTTPQSNGEAGARADQEPQGPRAVPERHVCLQCGLHQPAVPHQGQHHPAEGDGRGERQDQRRGAQRALGRRDVGSGRAGVCVGVCCTRGACARAVPTRP
jgi:hypothetical protein